MRFITDGDFAIGEDALPHHMTLGWIGVRLPWNEDRYCEKGTSAEDDSLDKEINPNSRL